MINQISEQDRRCMHLSTDRRGCVSRIYTDLATIDTTPQGLRVIDRVDGLSLAGLRRLSGVPMLDA